MRRDADPTPWNTARAMAFGAAIGAVAAGFKLLAPWNATLGVAAMAREIVGAALAFALLCGLAAAARNFAVGRLIGPKAR
ncbi:MAG TPA: hypothetical protein VHX43_10940 [Xanthobacteraceae bacterium]|jgi:hypothetical protein|nr:hypothetical protein [Xanthobacteraceae bacterium]